MKILVVDDSAAMRKLIARGLATVEGLGVGFLLYRKPREKAEDRERV